MPILSPMTSNQPDSSSPVTEESEHELDTFSTLQQQQHTTNTIAVHQLSKSFSSSQSSNPACTVEKTRAHQVLKRKHPNAQTLILQYTYFSTNDQHLKILDEYSLFLDLSLSLHKPSVTFSMQ